MKHKTVIIPYLTFLTDKEASDSSRYPHSGLFVVTIDDRKQTKTVDEKDVFRSDLRLVDKNLPHAQCLVPEERFNKILHEFEVPEVKNEIVSQPKLDGYTSNDFIIEFTKTLLNLKK